ncbi:hypothetical protein DdX_19047 [Ditylenchus destructor]|uniref:Uncharacterized protein n=1 Tax=Ditylenchus destructor TaxID=166010 RepID=A0AAD4MNC5_9BILA|nr:hypothetical protein DdX_19047 [Ditylenchus destructor]
MPMLPSTPKTRLRLPSRVNANKNAAFTFLDKSANFNKWFYGKPKQQKPDMLCTRQNGYYNKISIAVRDAFEDNILIKEDPEHLLSIPVNQHTQETPSPTIRELFNTHSTVNNLSILALKLVKTDNATKEQ